MPLAPQHRRRALYANADQNLTEVDTRLPKLDTVNPCPNPKPQRNHNRARRSDTPSINLRCQPLQRTLNKSEQT